MSTEDASFKIFDWNEETKEADFYRQGVVVLSMKLDSYAAASSIYLALSDNYKAGVKDGITWCVETLQSQRELL